MKKTITLVALIILCTSSAYAGWNFNLFGSNDKQKKQRYAVSQPVNPNNPVSVPEPATILLIGTGIVGLIIAKKRKS